MFFASVSGVFFATVARVGVFCVGYEPVFSASVPRCFCDGPGCLLHWQPVFFATVVFSALGSGVFCHGNQGILRQLEGGLNENIRLVLVYYAYDNLDLYDTRHEREYEY